jgi:hypothetical protein
MTPPLARALLKLRGVPGFPKAIGRPRKAEASPTVDAFPSDRLVTAPPEATNGRAVAAHQRASQASAKPLDTGSWPRLLTLPRLADYLGLGIDSARELANTGALRAARVTVPAPVTRKRKNDRIALVLLNRLEVDRLVSTWRDT